MLKKLLFTLFVCIYISAYGQYKISGVLSSSSGELLTHVAIYKQGSSRGTLTNDQGRYTLYVEKGKHSIVYKYIGYKVQSRHINIYQDTTIDIVLAEEDLNLDEMVFVAGEDPAIPIMKKAIAKREENKAISNSFEVDVYSKGVMKFVDTPKKLLGRDIGDMNGILDSNRQGIFYLSEAKSKVYFKPPSHQKEIMLSSIVSGESRSVSVNQFNYSNFNFYRENISLFRELVSPLSDNALLYYHFYLYESPKDENGYTVHKIRVKPKDVHRPCFNGFIYITDSLYNIHSTDLKVSALAIKSQLIDSVKIQQVYVPQQGKKNWYLLTSYIDFGFSVFGFKANGNFRYILSDYKHDQIYNDNFFNSETFKAEKSVIKNDFEFWKNQRPVPLTPEEAKDYVKKDSISTIVHSKPYRDSVDRANNKFKVADLIFGYTSYNSFKNLSLDIPSPLNSIWFNAVEGFTYSTYPKLTKSDEETGARIWSANTELRYGNKDKQLKWSAAWSHTYNRKSLSKYGIDIGRNYFQYNENGIVSVAGNTINSLMSKSNVLKIFEKKYIKLDWSSEVANGLILDVQSSLAARNDLNNNTNYSLFNKEKYYSPNNPFNIDDNVYSFSDHIFINTIGIRWSPGQKYQSYPHYKNRIQSRYPIFYLKYEGALPLTKNYVDFSKIRLTIYDNYIPMKIFGYQMFRLEVGKFLSKEKISDLDLFHFKGNSLYTGYRSPYLQTFKLQQEYEFSNTNSYVGAWLEHHFDGFIMDKIPGLNKLGITTIASISALHDKDKTYLEPGIGIEGISLGALDIMRLDYFWGIKNGALYDKGIRIGFSTLIENIFSRR
jgi:hypothetical protein